MYLNEPKIWFADFVVVFFFSCRFETLSRLMLDLLLCSSICQFCALDSHWVVGQSYNSHSVSWSNPISKTAVSSFLCFPGVRLLLITLTEMDGIHTVLRLDCAMRYCTGFKRKMMFVPAWAPAYLMGSHFHLDHSTTSDVVSEALTQLLIRYLGLY